MLMRDLFGWPPEIVSLPIHKLVVLRWMSWTLYTHDNAFYIYSYTEREGYIEGLLQIVYTITATQENTSIAEPLPVIPV